MPVYLKCGKCDRFNHERHEKSQIKREISPHPPHESSGRDFHRLNAEVKNERKKEEKQAHRSPPVMPEADSPRRARQPARRSVRLGLLGGDRKRRGQEGKLYYR
jgi:hypothetical protein